MRRSTSRLASAIAWTGLAGTTSVCGGPATPDPTPVTPPPATRQACLAAAEFVDPADSPYCLPYARGEAYEVGQSYCSPPSWSHETRFAYDFLMPLGTEVRAARAGLVVELREHWPDDDRTGGHENMVSLRHEDETISIYMHMRQNGVLVEMGEHVGKGELLGWSGSSGDTQGIPHLHFQICLRSGMCSWNTGEYTLPITFRNAEGALDSLGGLAAGETYTALPCD